MPSVEQLNYFVSSHICVSGAFRAAAPVGKIATQGASRSFISVAIFGV